MNFDPYVEVLLALDKFPHDATDAYELTEDIKEKTQIDLWRTRDYVLVDILETLESMGLIEFKRIPELHVNGIKITDLGKVVVKHIKNNG